MQQQNNDQIFGAAGRGEYRIGDQMTFLENGRQFTGEVIHVAAPGTTTLGRKIPTTYQVDAGNGWPHIVISSQIVQQ